MIGYDVESTRLARGEETGPAPTNGEIFGVLVALLLLNNTSVTFLCGRQLELSEENYREVGSVIRERLKSFDLEFGGAAKVDDRLRRLIGLTVTWYQR